MSKEQVKLKPSLKSAFRDVAARAAHLPEPAPVIPKWEAHQFACMFDIKMPKDRSKCTEYLATELNKMIECLHTVTAKNFTLILKSCNDFDSIL